MWAPASYPTLETRRTRSALAPPTTTRPFDMFSYETIRYGFVSTPIKPREEAP